MLLIDYRVVMQSVAGRMYELEIAPAESIAAAILRDLHALGGNGDELAIQLLEALGAIDGLRAGNQLLGRDHVRRAPWM